MCLTCVIRIVLLCSDTVKQTIKHRKLQIMNAHTSNKYGSLAERNRRRLAKRHKTVACARFPKNRHTGERYTKRNIRIEAKRLIRKFMNEMAYDCHGMDAKYGRSQTKDAIISLGPLALPAIIKFLKGHFKGKYTGTKSSGDEYWECFGVWTWITFAIIRRCGIEPPYPTQSFIEMNMGVIIEACEATLEAVRSGKVQILTMDELEAADRC